MRTHRIKFISVLWLALAAVVAPAAAQEVGGGLRIGTPDDRRDVDAPPTERFGVRWQGDGSLRAYNESSGPEAGSRFATGFLLADWYPYASGFRLSGGLFNLTGPRDAVSQVGQLNGRAGLLRATPYLGLGWGLASRGAGLYLSADLGLVYQRPSAGLTGSCVTVMPPSVCTQLQSDLRNDEPELRQSPDDMRLYPVLSVGFGLRF